MTRVVVAGVLLAASLLKFSSLLADGSWLSAGNALTATLATIELIGAVVLLVHRPGAVIWATCILAFVAFACISGFHAWNGAPTCGCFGKLAVPPIWTLALDLAIVATLLAFPPAGWPSAAGGPMWAWSRGWRWVVALASVAGAASAAVSLGFAPPEKEVAPGVIERGDQLVLTPAKWVGHPLPIMDLIGRQGDFLRNGEWEVWIFDPNCAACARALSAASRQKAALSPLPARVLISVGETPPDQYLESNADFGDSILSLDTELHVICPVPTRLTCNDLIVSQLSLP
jgi:hypothetical protein